MGASGGLVDKDGDIDLWVLGARLWAGRWWLFSSAISFSAIFAAAAFLMTPMYRATTVLVDASDNDSVGAIGSALGQMGGLASLVGIDIGSRGSKVEESLAVLRSREFTESFIREEKLMPELFHRRWDADAGRWRGSEDDWPTLAEAFKFFHERVRTLNQDSRTGLITLQIVWREPEKAASWANALVARLNAEMRDRAIASTNASVGYLEKEMAVTSTVETRLAIARLMESQINQRMLASVTEEYAFRVVDRALPPDPRDPVRPRKLVLSALGALVGLVLGACAVLVARVLTTRR